jgi:hypothetical protein
MNKTGLRKDSLFNVSLFTQLLATLLLCYIPEVASVNNNPAASAVDEVIAAVGFRWVPAVAGVPADDVAGVHAADVAVVPAAAVVFTAADIPEVPAVAKVPDVAAILIAVDMLSINSVFYISGVPPVVGVLAVVGVTAFVDLPTVAGVPTVADVPTVAGVPTVENIPAVNIVSIGSPSLLLPSSDIPFVCCTAVSSSVYVVLSAVNLPGDPVVAFLLFLTSLLLSCLHQF